ncbi:hypothetical protein [Amycolatopsis jejuensis]|uniref:hypothetical protein n=1 Tax=Amycolatopsis jejuensis TaxID=330084 RepID=UPI000526A46E|nr:hypothetical protein [Amycolatopsis jejuensis]
MNSGWNKVIVAVLAVGSVSACGLGQGLKESSNGHVKAVAYDTGRKGKADTDARLPPWVPDDAQAVKELIRTTGSERILRYQPGATGLPETCKSGVAEAKPPTLSAEWWPSGEHRRTDKVCDGWHVAVESDAVYAYRAESLTSTQ